MIITMDGVQYRLRVRAGTLNESFRIGEGPNSDKLLDGTQVRDVIGTYYEHRLDVEADPAAYADYTAFYQAISAPVPYHTITLPHEDGSITYEAMVTDGSHTSVETVAGQRRYNGLSVYFKARAPQRSPA